MVSVFNQSANFLAKELPRPDNMAAELKGTSFVNDDDGRVRAKYTVIVTNAKKKLNYS